MFDVVSEPINCELLRHRLENVSGGGVVIFEGRVRNHNEGRPVERLEYEVYHELAHAEAARILTEAREQFDILDAVAVHREGMLGLGDVAVWVGVIARHRDAAFVACRFIIDEIKWRLPIWKREFYVGSDPVWVNCQGCALHHQHRDEHGDRVGRH
jgi:molybdopterin synthase catalytic subunit